MKRLVLLFAIFYPTLLFASDQASDKVKQNFESLVANYSLKGVFFSFLLLVVLLSISIFAKKLNEVRKRLLFWAIVGITTITTFGLIGSTIYLNRVAWSDGPIHWHADIEVWACEGKLNFSDPKGLSNKIGTSTLHEHNDERIHFEGVVLAEADAYLENFFHVIGGQLTSQLMRIPTNGGEQIFESGDECANAEMGKVQVFVYRVNPDKTYYQTKLADPAHHLMQDASQVPPGDCIIVEFSTHRAKTDHLCQSYQVANKIGKLKGEVRGD